jgi:hypothetical protein
MTHLTSIHHSSAITNFCQHSYGYLKHLWKPPCMTSCITVPETTCNPLSHNKTCPTHQRYKAELKWEVCSHCQAWYYNYVGLQFPVSTEIICLTHRQPGRLDKRQVDGWMDKIKQSSRKASCCVNLYFFLLFFHLNNYQISFIFNYV